MSTAPSLIPERREPSVLDRPEVREAIARLRTVLEELRDDYEPTLLRARSLPEEARSLSINDRDDLVLTEAWVQNQPLAVRDQIREKIGPRKKLSNTVHKFLCDLESLGLDPCQEAIDVANAKIKDFYRREDIARREAEARARAVQREAERHALLARGPYLIGCAIAQAAQCVIEDEQRELLAKAAAAAGDEEAAEAMRGEVGSYTPADFEVPPVTVAPAVFVPEKPKVKGQSVQENWKGRLKADMDPEIALDRVIQFVAKNPAYRSLFKLDQSQLDRLAKTHRGRLSEVVPGLEAYDAGKVQHRRR